MSEWIKKNLQYIDVMAYYSAIKRTISINNGWEKVHLTEKVNLRLFHLCNMVEMMKLL